MVIRLQCTDLFFAVSTDLIIKAPLVPGSFTYSNFGGGACPATVLPDVFLPSTVSEDFTESACGWSSERLELKALLMIRGMNRE